MKIEIENTVKDMVTDFLYYDRKGDESLSQDDLYKSFKSGETTIYEVVELFKNQLTEGLSE